ncbi:MAG TPA: hypothetical protein VIJ19_04640 [Opitutaceae bacterium]
MIIAALLAATAASSQDAPQASLPAAAPRVQADTSNIILAPKAASEAPSAAPANAAPTGISADIETSLPKFKQEPARQPEGQLPDLRDIDKPKNIIPRLPANLMSRYVVRGAKVPVFRERDLYTKEGLIDNALRDHPGLRVGNLFGLNRNAAYEAFLEDERAGKMHDLDDTALAFAVGGDPDEAKMILDETGDSFIRDIDESGPVHIK